MKLKDYLLFVIALNMLLFHVPLYTYVLEHSNVKEFDGILTFVLVLISLFVVSTLFLFLFALISSRLVKYFILLMMPLNAVALYFVQTYHTILDKTMMGNVFNTNSSEAFSYYHPKIFLYLFLGLLLSYGLSKIDITKSKRITLLKYGLSIIFIGILILYLNASKWLWLDKHAKRLGALAMPWSYMINAVRYKAKEMRANKKQILLPDATFLKNDDEKTVVILVIGESARAKNFSLYGYERETNPQLKKLGVKVLKNSSSTTTYTTASVHSMLSYKGSSSDSYEPLPNYLQRQGVAVTWRTNNWGEPPLKVQSYERKSDLKASCVGDECGLDGVLLRGLKERIASSDNNRSFYVLHTAGSHGPSYYEKYPKAFEEFTPVCKTVDLQKCTQQELVNAYDNTILYTDYLLAKIITMLKEQKDIATLLVYISDHGESLGEYGLYLHGTPYSIAPDVQKKIPFLFWASDKFKERKGIEQLALSEDEYGQYNIFHSILGAFDMNSSIYNEELDIFN